MPQVFETQLVALPANPNGTALPLAHSTDWARFLAITRVGEFQSTKKCPVYGELLLYTFYGRPAYRFQNDDLAHSTLSYMPVCFLLDPTLINSAQRILPFDSGGFDRYAAAMHPSYTREMFELSPGSASANRIIDAFWQTNRQYVSKAARIGLTFSAAADLLTHYYLLITNQLAVHFDDRCSSVEIQLPSPIVLKGNVLEIAAPVVSDPAIATIATTLGADLLQYPFEMPYYINDFHMSVRQVVRDFLEMRAFV
jgi:hypothetical protein